MYVFNVHVSSAILLLSWSLVNVGSILIAFHTWRFWRPGRYVYNSKTGCQSDTTPILPPYYTHHLGYMYRTDIHVRCKCLLQHCIGTPVQIFLSGIDPKVSQNPGWGSKFYMSNLGNVNFNHKTAVLIVFQHSPSPLLIFLQMYSFIAGILAHLRCIARFQTIRTVLLYLNNKHGTDVCGFEHPWRTDGGMLPADLCSHHVYIIQLR